MTRNKKKKTRNPFSTTRFCIMVARERLRPRKYRFILRNDIISVPKNIFSKEKGRCTLFTSTWIEDFVWCRDGGMKGLFTGVGPRVARAGPSVGIVVSFYEVAKYVLHNRRVNSWQVWKCCFSLQVLFFTPWKLLIPSVISLIQSCVLPILALICSITLWFTRINSLISQYAIFLKGKLDGWYFTGVFHAVNWETTFAFKVFV